MIRRSLSMPFLVRRSRGGFTLIEMLAVIAIIGVLVCLLLPGIMYAREAARRMNCANNLGQLILAVNQYEMAHGVYPAGTIDAKGPIVNARIGYHHNWLVQSLPFLEQENLWDAVDKKQSIYHPKNTAIQKSTGGAIWICPSQGFYGGTMSNYAACHNDVESPIDANNNGVFFLNSRIRYEDVQDGTSSTIFLGEKLIDAYDFEWCSGTRGTLRNTGSAINLLTFDNGGLPTMKGTPISGVADTPALPPGMKGDPLDVPGLESDKNSADADATVPRDAAPASGKGKAAVAKVTIGNSLFVGGFSSMHPNGAQFAFGDGSVRYLNQMITGPVLQQLGHRADGKLPVDLY